MLLKSVTILFKIYRRLLLKTVVTEFLKTCLKIVLKKCGPGLNNMATLN